MPRLYHFTCHRWWHFIKTEGITRGEVPVNATTVLDYPNLTVDPDMGAQTWSCGSAAHPVDKQAVRITVDVPEGDERLVTWRSLTREHGMDRQCYRELDERGGWKAKNWWIFLGPIPPAWFADVTIFADPGAIELGFIEVAKGFASYAAFEREYCEVGPMGNKEFSLNRILGGKALTSLGLEV